jgi:hypothetical protein
MKNNIEKIIHNTLRTYLNEQTSGLPDWTKNYPCLSDRGTMNKTTSNDQVVFFLENGNMFFYGNNRFFYYDKSNKEKGRGSWDCKNGKLVMTADDDGAQWTKDTGWVDITSQNTAPAAQNTTPVPNIGDGVLVPVTVAIFQGIESILGKGLGTIKNGVTYIPEKIMDQYKKSLQETKYRYKDEKGVVSDIMTYKEIGDKISNGNVKLTTPVKRMLYNVTTERIEPGETKKASDYPELKGYFWGDESQASTNSGTTKKGKYTKCSEELPIKQYCKNETIKKVQACLAMPSNYQTGNFGTITQGYLERKGQNGTLITTETIINVCGSNHPLVPDVPYSSVPKTGYEDYTVDEIEYSDDVQNTKSATPQPVSPSTPKPAPPFSSEIPGLQSSKKSFANRTMDSDAIEQ